MPDYLKKLKSTHEGYQSHSRKNSAINISVNEQTFNSELDQDMNEENVIAGLKNKYKASEFKISEYSKEESSIRNFSVNDSGYMGS